MTETPKNNLFLDIVCHAPILSVLFIYIFLNSNRYGKRTLELTPNSRRPSQLSSSLRRQVWSAIKRLDTISPKLLIMFDPHLGWFSSEIFKVATNMFYPTQSRIEPYTFWHQWRCFYQLNYAPNKFGLILDKTDKIGTWHMMSKKYFSVNTRPKFKNNLQYILLIYRTVF